MYASFFRRQRRGEFDLANRDELWGLLVRITLCKARNSANKHRRKKRDVRREQACAASLDDGEPNLPFLVIQDRAPGPAEAALLNEALERRLEALGDPALRLLALKKLEGWTNAEIALSIGRTERCVERRLKRIRECWAGSEPVLAKPIDGAEREESGP
jgi:DNA-directed RNA polymerase specialized sigma24 family protein